jgi:DnaJ-class molecular chaperone
MSRLTREQAAIDCKECLGTGQRDRVTLHQPVVSAPTCDECGGTGEASPVAVAALWDDIAKSLEPCPTCATADAMTPRHDASPRCESGGRPHCTCDRCY